MSDKNLGLHVHVFRSSLGDCTNSGVSSQFNTGILTGEDVDCAVFEPSDDCPEYVFIKDTCAGRERVRAVPRDLHDSGVWTIFGGNFLYTSDSRLPSSAPIKIFDRVED